LQRGWCRFDSDRLHSSLRSVNGKHAPVVRPRCGFDSCRRLLLCTPVAQRKSAALRRQRTLVRLQPGVLHADVAQSGERRSATPERPVRSGSSAFASLWCNRKHRELQPRGSGFESWRACLYERSSRAEATRLPLAAVAERSAPCGSTPLPERTPRPRRSFFCCGPETLPLSTPNRQVAGSSPARSAPCSGSSVVEQFGRHTTTAADRIDRGPKRVGYLSPREQGRQRTSARG
jgi:hypothetical protein